MTITELATAINGTEQRISDLEDDLYGAGPRLKPDQRTKVQTELADTRQLLGTLLGR